MWKQFYLIRGTIREKRVCRKQRKPEQVIQNRAAETFGRQQKRQQKYSKMDTFLKSKKEFPA